MTKTVMSLRISYTIWSPWFWATLSTACVSAFTFEFVTIAFLPREKRKKLTRKHKRITNARTHFPYTQIRVRTHTCKYNVILQCRLRVFFFFYHFSGPWFHYFIVQRIFFLFIIFPPFFFIVVVSSPRKYAHFRTYSNRCRHRIVLSSSLSLCALERTSRDYENNNILYIQGSHMKFSHLKNHSDCLEYVICVRWKKKRLQKCSSITNVAKIVLFLRLFRLKKITYTN